MIDWSCIDKMFPFYDYLDIQKSDLILEYKDNYEYNVDNQSIDTSINYLEEKVDTPEGGYHRCGYFKPKIATWLSTIDSFWKACIKISVAGISGDLVGDAAGRFGGIGIGDVSKSGGYITSPFMGFEFRKTGSSILVYGKVLTSETLLRTIAFDEAPVLEFRFYQPNSIYFFINNIYEGFTTGSLTSSTIRQFISFLDYWNDSTLITPATVTLEVSGAQIGTGWRT
jgi:hypothetical protein